MFYATDFQPGERCAAIDSGQLGVIEKRHTDGSSGSHRWIVNWEDGTRSWVWETRIIRPVEPKVTA